MLRTVSGISLFCFLFLFPSIASQAAVFKVHQSGTEIVIVKGDANGDNQLYEVDPKFLSDDEIFEAFGKLRFEKLPELEQIGIRKKISSVLVKGQLLSLLKSSDHTFIVNEEEPGLRKPVFTVLRGMVQPDIKKQDWTNGFCFDTAVKFGNLYQSGESVFDIERFTALQDQFKNNSQRKRENKAEDDLDLNKSVKKLAEFLEERKDLFSGVPPLKMFFNLNKVRNIKDRPGLRVELVEAMKANLSTLKPTSGAILNSAPDVDQKKEDVSKLFENTKAAILSKRLKLNEGNYYAAAKAYPNGQNHEENKPTNPDVQDLNANKAKILAQLKESQITLNDNELDALLKLQVKTYEERIKVRESLTEKFIESIANFDKAQGKALLENLNVEKQAVLKGRLKQMNKKNRQNFRLKRKKLLESEDSDGSNFSENDLDI